jgi:predicted phosphodiesterase
MCSESDFHTLNDIAMTYMCKGNNDWGYTYDSFVTNLVRFFAAGLRWEVCHYQERLDLATCEVAICGHTHRPLVTRDAKTGVLIMNPGSPTFPRAGGTQHRPHHCRQRQDPEREDHPAARAGLAGSVKGRRA